MVPCVDISMDVLFLYLVGIYMNYDYYFFLIFFFLGLKKYRKMEKNAFG